MTKLSKCCNAPIDPKSLLPKSLCFICSKCKEGCDYIQEPSIKEDNKVEDKCKHGIPLSISSCCKAPIKTVDNSINEDEFCSQCGKFCNENTMEKGLNFIKKYGNLPQEPSTSDAEAVLLSIDPFKMPRRTINNLIAEAIFILKKTI